MEKIDDKKSFKINELSDGEFLAYLYAERDREESLNHFQGWNLWAVVGAMITVACAAYSIICNHSVEINRLRTGYLISDYMSRLFLMWYVVVSVKSFVERKRATDYKKIKCLKDVVPMPYLIVATICTIELALFFIIFEQDNLWDVVPISWMVLAVSHLLIDISVYRSRNSFVWAIKEDTWFVRTWVMVAVGMYVYVLVWLIWQWSYKHITGPFLDTPEFEFAVCVTAFVLLFYLLLMIVLANRKSSETDVLIDEYVYKGKSKEDVYMQLKANRFGYGILEACSQELLALKKYSDDYESQKKTLDVIKVSFSDGGIGVDSVVERFVSLKESFEYNDEWANRVDALFKKLDEIGRNVPELKNEEEFNNLYSIAGGMMKKSKEMHNEIKSMMNELQKFFDEHSKGEKK
jgi:hypothetical protein